MLLGVLLVGMWVAERGKRIGQRILLPVGLALLLSLFDNVVFMDLCWRLHFRYVFLLLVIFF